MTGGSITFSGQLDFVRNNCRKQLIDMLTTNDIKLLDLIDPLLSDNQCHIHAMFLLNILLKCYSYEDCVYDVNRLDDDDIETLIDSVLLTLIKIERTDGFGMVLRQESLNHFGGYLHSKKQERKFIVRIKENFNSKSVDFVRAIAEKSVRKILDDCVATIPHSQIKLKVLPCYAALYALVNYLKTKRLPILITLKRIELHGFPSATKYKVNGLDIYYYMWNGLKFQCCENISKCELNQPSMTFDCYSLYNVASYLDGKYEKYVGQSKYPSHSFFIGCDIGHLIMSSLASHFQLSESRDLTINPGHITSENYIHSIYRNSSTESKPTNYSVDSQFDYDCINVFEQYLGHLRLAMDFNGEHSQYSKHQRCVSIRRTQNAFFGVRHARVSNYVNEYAKKLGFNADVELEQTDIIPDVNKEESVFHFFKKLEMKEECEFLVR